jgi:glycerol-3-phosphate dehydrogenase
MAATKDVEVAVIGAGVVGCAVALALARRGVTVGLLEAESAPALGASGTNSGILHTGFDSTPGELETELILASAALRPPLLETLGIPVLDCGAVMSAGAAVDQVASRARENGVVVREQAGGVVEVPGESVTDPVVYALALAQEAERQGAEPHTGFRVAAIEMDSRLTVRSEAGAGLRCRLVVNCAGLHADEVARLAGDDSFSIYPRKGEFLVFDPSEGAELEHILLPVPSGRTKGVLVFPTLDGKIVAGPTAVDQVDKGDWSMRAEARAEIMPKAMAMYPALEHAEPIASYAGLRPAGRGVNYVIGPSSVCERLINVAAIRSTGLTASLGIGQRVAEIVASLGVQVRAERPLIGGPLPRLDRPWWQRTATYRGARA